MTAYPIFVLISDLSFDLIRHVTLTVDAVTPAEPTTPPLLHLRGRLSLGEPPSRRRREAGGFPCFRPWNF